MALENVVLPGIIVLLTALAIPGLGYLLSDDRKGIIPWFALVALLFSAFLTLNMLGLPILENIGIGGFEGPVSEVHFNGLIHIDAFSLLFVLIFQIVAIMVVAASMSYVRGEDNQPEYYSLLLLATMGMMLVAAAGDLFIMFIGLELASLSTYVLAGFRKDSLKSTEAAMKYYIIGGFSSAIALFGISLIYGITGTTNIYELGGMANASFHSTGIIAWVMLLAGFGFKIAAAPFHMWAPDVYEGAPTTISAFLASGSKKMGFVVLFKVFLIGLVLLKGDWDMIIAFLAILTMTVGNVIAISQTSMKRMLAYSSIAQAGYIMIALVVGSHENADIARFAIAGGMLHILTHAFMKTGAFVMAGIMEKTTGSDNIKEYIGLHRRAPLLAFCMVIFMLSLAGIPPLAGFFSKFVLFSTAINAGSWYIWLAVAGILNSAISLYYYARIIKFMYVLPDKESHVKRFAELSGRFKERLTNSRSMVVIVTLIMLAVIVIGIYPEPFLELCVRAGEALIP